MLKYVFSHKGQKRLIDDGYLDKQNKRKDNLKVCKTF